MIKLIIKRFTIFVIILSVATSFIAVGHWFVGNKILYFWDSFIPFDPKVSFDQLFYFWREGIFPGYATPSWSWFLYWGLFFLPYVVTHSLSVSQAFIYLLLLSLSIINFYFLCSYILGNVFAENRFHFLLKSTAFVCALLYTLNIFTFSNFLFMFNPGMFILALLPLNLLALFHIYPIVGEENHRRNNLWLFVFLISLIGMSPGFTVYVFFLQYLVWLFVYLILFWIVSKKGILSRLTFELMGFIILVILFNLWWFYPSLLGLKEAYSSQSSFGTTIWFDQGFEPSQLLNAIRLMGSGLMINNKFPWSILYEQNYLFTFPLFIFPLLFFTSFIFLKKQAKPLLTFFLLMALISLFIIKFSNPPFSLILGFAYRYVPFFGGFRDAFQKAGVYFLPAYFIFIAIGLFFTGTFLWKKRLKLILYSFIVVFTIGSIILTGPFFLFFNNSTKSLLFTYDKEDYTINARTQIPPEYLSFKTFFENKCKGETTMIVPRAGFITDAVWKKYNTSYIGQDMLVGLVHCNFLATSMFSKYSESAIQAPYLQLEQGDINAFKNYLVQNNIRYVLIRKDFVPHEATGWVYVEPQKAEALLFLDQEFSKIYTNDFFTLFEKTTQKKQQYGFNLTQDVVFLQSDINSGTDFANISKRIGNINQPVLLSAPLDRINYEDKATVFTTVGNCIGCIRIDTRFIAATSSFQRVKNFIKSMIPKWNSNKPIDIQISLGIVSADDTFKKLAANIEAGNGDRLKEDIRNYINKWNKVYSLVSAYRGDRFATSNKRSEASNFLEDEKNTVYDYLSTQFKKDHKYLRIPKNNEMVVSLLTFQKNLLGYFSNKIIKTDFDRMAYRMRLDIPKDGNYTCEALNIKNNAKITSVLVENQILTAEEGSGKTPIPFKKGSYLASVFYQPNEILRSRINQAKSEEVKEIKIGNLNPGTYKINFELSPESSGRMIIAISQGQVSQGLLKYFASLEKPDENFFVVDALEKNVGNPYHYSYTFTINLPSKQDYYAYLYYLDGQNLPIAISDITVISKINIGDFQFSCDTKINTNRLSNAKLSIDKKNPVQYVLSVPSGYTGFLVFNQTYDTDWIAYPEGSNNLLPHLISGYANAWYIKEPVNRKIIVEYRKQKLIEIVGIYSVLLSFLWLVIYKYIRKS